MRTIVGVIAVLGLAVAVARAQPPRERGASFRPPEPLGPNELPPGTVARGASEEFPPSSFLPSTPVARTVKAASGGTGPAWLSGVDPNVLPAAGSASKTGTVRPLSSATAARDKEDPFTPPKALEKLKGSSRTQPTAQAPPAEQPTAATPFRGTGANGSPVYAGPPAYRWYGYGTVTPGANQFAPTGQYPKASANWYSITGATPGAFPVPVMNPLRNPPGTEPPSYATAAPSANPATVISASGTPATVQPQPAPPVQAQPQSRPLPVERPEPSKFNPTGESKFVPTPGPAPLPVPVPKLTPAPTVPVATAPVPPPVVPEPSFVTPPGPLFPPAPPKAEPVAVAPPVIPPAVIPPPVMSPPALEFPSVAPVRPVAPEAPATLPTSVMNEQPAEAPKSPEPKPPEPRREEHKWQAAPEPTHATPGTWAPAGAPSAQPPAPAAPANEMPAWKSGSANVKPIVARGQAPDKSPDPIETLIRQMCRDRADGVEVRGAGTKKLMVCFEVRTTADAQKLVTDISKRPELAPYQIDFCAVVKK